LVSPINGLFSNYLQSPHTSSILPDLKCHSASNPNGQAGKQAAFGLINAMVRRGASEMASTAAKIFDVNPSLI